MPSAEFTGKMRIFLRSLADFLSVLAFLLCCCIFDSYITCLTLSFHTVYVYFHSHYFFVRLYPWTVVISATFKSILSQSKSSLGPNNFLTGATPQNPCCISPLRNPQLRWRSVRLLFRWLCLLLGSCLFNHNCGIQIKILSRTIWIFKTNNNFKQQIYFQ